MVQIMIISGLYPATTWVATTYPLQAPAILLPQAIHWWWRRWQLIEDDGSNARAWSYHNNVPHHDPPAGVSAVSSESCCSRKSSITRDFSFSSLSNFQVMRNLMMCSGCVVSIFAILYSWQTSGGEVVGKWADLALHFKPQTLLHRMQQVQIRFIRRLSPTCFQQKYTKFLLVPEYTLYSVGSA